MCDEKADARDTLGKTKQSVTEVVEYYTKSLMSSMAPENAEKEGYLRGKENTCETERWGNQGNTTTFPSPKEEETEDAEKAPGVIALELNKVYERPEAWIDGRIKSTMDLRIRELWKSNV